VTRMQSMSPRDPIYDVEKRVGAIATGNTPPTVPEPVTDNPTIVASFTHADLDEPRRIWAVGNTLFVSCHNSDVMMTLDATDPLNLVHMDSSPTTSMNGPVGFALDGTDLFVTTINSDTLTAVDASNQSAMTFISDLTHANINNPNDVVVVGNYAYLACLSGRITRCNISNPASMTQTNSDFAGATSNAVIAAAPGGSYVYFGRTGGVSVYDITNVAVAPSVTTTLSMPTTTVAGVLVVGSLLFVHDVDGKFYVYDISSPGSPSLLGDTTSSTLLGAGCMSAHSSGNYIYVAGATGDYMVVVDVTTPASPSVVGSITHADLNGASDTASIGLYVFVAATDADKITTIGQGP
jgi:hypothetical protein